MNPPWTRYAFGLRLTGWVLFLAAILPLAGLGLAFWLHEAGRHEGRGATPHVANAHLVHAKLPPEARDVNFRRSPGEICQEQADFVLTASEFLDWAKAMGWETQVFQRRPDWPMPDGPGASELPADLQFGFFAYECHASSATSGVATAPPPAGCARFTLAYHDHDAGRAYYRHCRQAP